MSVLSRNFIFKYYLLFLGVCDKIHDETFQIAYVTHTHTYTQIHMI